MAVTQEGSAPCENHLFASLILELETSFVLVEWYCVTSLFCRAEGKYGGGYLLYLQPTDRVYIRGRSNLLKPTQNHQHLIQTSSNHFKSNPDRYVIHQFRPSSLGRPGISCAAVVSSSSHPIHSWRH